MWLETFEKGVFEGGKFDAVVYAGFVWFSRGREKYTQQLTGVVRGVLAGEHTPILVRSVVQGAPQHLTNHAAHPLEELLRGGLSVFSHPLLLIATTHLSLVEAARRLLRRRLPQLRRGAGAQSRSSDGGELAQLGAGGGGDGDARVGEHVAAYHVAINFVVAVVVAVAAYQRVVDR